MLEIQGIPFIITNPPLQPVPLKELSEVENEFGFLFPDDYRTFITTFGAGYTNFSIRTFTPREIFQSFLQETRDRLSECWFWQEDPKILTQSRAVECVPFFDSGGGDDIIFHPSDRERWFILPHEEENIIIVSSFRELCDFYVQRCRDDDGNRATTTIDVPFSKKKFWPFNRAEY
jgi:hypothetical protein